MRTKKEIECDKGCKVFFTVVLLVIIVASYMALNTDYSYHASSYMDSSTMRYDCVDCAKIVTLQNVWIDENGVVRHLT